MKPYLSGLILLMAPFLAVSGNCDLTDFRWMCRLPVQPGPTRHTPSVIDCDGTNVFVTWSQYEKIMQYQRANVNMTLKVNGEYISSPCVPGKL